MQSVKAVAVSPADAFGPVGPDLRHQSPRRPHPIRIRPRPSSRAYSVKKFLELHAYMTNASVWRLLYSILGTPLPGLIAALLPAMLPLQPLRDGADAAFFGHVFLVNFFVSWGYIIPLITVNGIPPSVYSYQEAFAVSLCSGGLSLVFTSTLAANWRFPIPFLYFIGMPMWLINTIVSHLLVLRAKCWRQKAILQAAAVYGPGLTVEVMQIWLYPAISVVFDNVNGSAQVLITVLFPMVKFALKHMLKALNRRLDRDQHGVVVVAAVEICASLYQSMIMQTAPSALAMAIIMALDVAQGIFAIKFLLGRPQTAVSCKKLNAEAYKILTDGHHDSLLQPHKAVSPATNSATVVPFCSIQSNSTALPMAPPAVNGSRTVTSVTKLRETVIVREALQLAQAAETVLLLEYFEVVIPVLNGIYLAIAVQFPAAFYNTRLSPLYRHNERLASAVGSILLYSSLQFLSYVVLHFVMKHRYGISATRHLAFVLERHRHPIRAKMIAWLSLILHFTSMHYGTDFSFRFAFAEKEQWAGPPPR